MDVELRMNIAGGYGWENSSGNGSGSALGWGDPFGRGYLTSRELDPYDALLSGNGESNGSGMGAGVAVGFGTYDERAY